MKESLLAEPLAGGKVRCHVCALRCTIPEGGVGACRTRLVRGGVLYTLLYGRVSSAFADPIEKKPLYHFHPGTTVLSMGTRGCNFRCPGCQNWEISHDRPAEDGSNLEVLDPAESARLAVRMGCQGICWTYNDPTIWLEHTLDAMREAKRLGLYTAYVTNGYATPEHLDLVAPYLDAWRVDLKAYSRSASKRISGIAAFEPVLEMTKLALHRHGMHVECVTNVTPTINDDEAELRGLARWIRAELGEFTPWHLTRFHPELDLSGLPSTPVRTLERIAGIAREEGLKYVYLGNVPGHPLENTSCHACGRLLIERAGFAVRRGALAENKCPGCGVRIPGRFDDSVPESGGGRLRIL